MCTLSNINVTAIVHGANTPPEPMCALCTVCTLYSLKCIYNMYIPYIGHIYAYIGPYTLIVFNFNRTH